MTASAQDPVDLLRRMEQAVMDRAPRLPEEAQGPALWTGIGFRLGNRYLVAPLGHIAEVLPCPAVTPVPRTVSWIKGVANVRGNLLTVVDLAEYFGNEPVLQDERARLLVMNLEAFNTGLLVNEVFGLRHFDEESESRDTAAVDDSVAPHVRGAFSRDDVLWGVFDIHSLVNSNTFMHVAA
ncbi:MAG: chemotaxis protein CheW [Acidiferrobacterales bacterium]|nr:chemotaxis protein CheW [Acidiferrobacterales bacterium]